MTHTSSKLIELGSTAFRQPRADSHCRFIHGYQLKAEITFACNKLDDNNWVFDFGGLKDLKSIFNNQFDHTLVVAGDDPELDKLKGLHEVGIAQLRIMDGGVGIEKFAEWCFKTAETFVEEATEGRVWVQSVTVYEHDNNFASCHKQIVTPTTFVDEEGTKTHVKEDATPEPTPEPAAQPGPPPKQGAPVGNQVTQGKGNWFEGTTWG
mgnify:FL=1|tara:strand:- start:372 stop:995 length:624 start_codon:yes stop_codon:yes gene_type:complete